MLLVLAAFVVVAAAAIAVKQGAGAGGAKPTPPSAHAVTSSFAGNVAPSPRKTKLRDCFRAPGACGYPDPGYANVGPSTACASLEPSSGITADTAGATIRGLNISGEVTITADDVTLTDDCVSAKGNGELGSRVLAIEEGVTGTQITHSDVSGANSTSESVEEALSNNNSDGGNAIADHDYIFNCGECVHGTWTLTNSYVTANATIPLEHYEDVYCNDTTFVAEHDVLINPHEQTADLFCDTNDGSGGAADNHITVIDSLLAGGGYSLYPQGNSSSAGSSAMRIAENRVARCLAPHVIDRASGGTDCRGGADSHGYYPFGGQYGVLDSDATYCSPASGRTGQGWSHNVWDNNNVPIGC
jgi:hypothetical protein